MARRTLILAVAGLVAAGCFGTAPSPAPPTTAPPTTAPPTTAPPTTAPPTTAPRATQACGQTFSTASEYQSAFDKLGQAGTGWVTADGFVPVPLPDGTTAWWMSDTMTGTANPDNSVPNAGNVHNSVVEQDATCLTPKFGNPAQINGTGKFYWPGSAVIEGNTMAVFAYKLEPASGPAGFDWKVLGTAVAHFALPSLQLLGPPTDMPVNNTPQDPYGGVAVPWGIHSFLNATDGKVYLYGTTRRSGPIPAADAWLARAPFDQLTSLEYFTDPLVPTLPSWSTNFADAKPMKFNKNGLPDSSPVAQLNVVPYGNRFLAGAFAADVFQDDHGRSFVRAWTSDTPRGPWELVVTSGGQPRDIAIFQRRTSDQIAYGARIVQLPGAGWTVVYNVNDPIHHWDDFTLYRGEFSPPSGLPAP